MAATVDKTYRTENGYNSVDFIVFEIKFGEMVAESHPHNIYKALIEYMIIFA